MKLRSVSSVADGALSMRLAARRLFLILASSLALGGCYPALKAVQPKVTLTVVDSRGVAIEAASFTLATFRQPFPFPHSTVLTTHRTDHDGRLALRKRREWIWQILLPDGVTWFTWAYCIEKPGFKATAVTAPLFDEPITVVLEDAPLASECVWPGEQEAYWDVRTSDDL
jgi:hypothetical protein